MSRPASGVRPKRSGAGLAGGDGPKHVKPSTAMAKLTSLELRRYLYLSWLK